MALELLNEILNLNIPVSSFISWLENKPESDEHFKKIILYGCSRGEFTIFFLNHLRDETETLLKSSHNQQTPIKIKTPRRNSLISKSDQKPSSAKRLFQSKSKQSALFNEADFPDLAKASTETESCKPLATPNSKNTNYLLSTPENKVLNISQSATNVFSSPNVSETSKVFVTSSPLCLSESAKRNELSIKHIHSTPITDSSIQSTPKRVLSHQKSSERSSSQLFKLNSSYNNSNRSTSSKKSINKSNDSKNYFDSLRSDSPSSSEKWKASKSNEICLGDFIVSDKINPKVKRNLQQNYSEQSESLVQNDIDSKTKRRIKPTSLINKSHDNNAQKNDGGLFSTNIRNIEPNPVFKVHGTKEDLYATSNRNLLRAECMKIKNQCESTVMPLTLTPKSKPSQDCDIITPNLNQVTFLDILNIYVDIYCVLLNENLVLNIMNEIYFVLSLLLSKQVQKDFSDFRDAFKNKQEELLQDELKKIDFNERTDGGYPQSNDKTDSVISHQNIENKYFSTIHNCVYFAVHVLLKQIDLLHIFDRHVIKTLRDNLRVQDFSPELHLQLQQIFDNKTEYSLKKSHTLLHSVKLDNANVCFISDTDNRSNFPTNMAFHAFRKQRDLFYQIIQIWETNHLNVNWNFATSLNSKIDNLMNLSLEPLNYMHLARLFKAQLLSSCGFGNASIEENGIANSLRNLSATKLSLLQSRLTTRQSGETQEFPDRQEFFKEFIMHVNKPQFLQHLIDIFICEIHDVQAHGIVIRDLESTDEIDEELRLSYIVTISSMKLLAKFLGLIQFLPYRQKLTNPIQENLILIQTSVRVTTQILFDVQPFIVDAIQNQTLILTIPWVCDYLAMTDLVALRLPQMKNSLFILFEIYRQCCISDREKSPFFINLPPSSIYFLKICLGWFFDRSHFPEEFYFQWLANKDFSDNEETCLSRLNQSISTIRLDALEIIDENVIYKACPYLNELKQLLANENDRNMKKTNITARHITPVTTITRPSAAKQLQLQMEDTFFNLHPSSVKKTVEFVAERVASSCVKYICYTFVPQIKKKYLLDFQKRVQNETKENMHKEARLLADTCMSEVLANYCSKDLCEKRCQLSLETLLSTDLSPAVVNLCIDYSSRQARDKILQWLTSHVTTDTFLKEFEIEILNKAKSSEENERVKVVDKSKKNSLTGLLSPVEAVTKLRDFIWDILDKGSVNFTVDDFKLLLSEIDESITKRCDYVFVIHKQVILLSIDLAILLVAQKPNLLQNENVLDLFHNIWSSLPDIIKKPQKQSSSHSNSTFNQVPFEINREDPHSAIENSKQNENVFTKLLCSKNVFLLESSKNLNASWTCMGQLLFSLLKKGILNVDLLGEECAAVFRVEWSKVILEHIGICIKIIIKEYKIWKKSDDEFTLLLEFLSETCYQIDDFDSFEF